MISNTCLTYCSFYIITSNTCLTYCSFYIITSNTCLTYCSFYIITNNTCLTYCSFDIVTSNICLICLSTCLAYWSLWIVTTTTCLSYWSLYIVTRRAPGLTHWSMYRQNMSHILTFVKYNKKNLSNIPGFHESRYCYFFCKKCLYLRTMLYVSMVSINVHICTR